MKTLTVSNEGNSFKILNSKFYRVNEKRVKIFSKYKILNEYETYDNFTSCCAELETKMGSLIVYGTLIGIYGNRNQNFKVDLPKQIKDHRNLPENRNLCLIGDFNISICDNYYFTNFGRNELNKSFAENEIKNLTGNNSAINNHIAISSKFIGNLKIEISEWNCGKKLSDHKGISVKIN